MSTLQPVLLEGWEQAKALGLALAVHALIVAALILGTWDWVPHKPREITGLQIEAVMVDTQALIERRDAAIAEAEAAQRREEQRQQRQRELAAQQERDRLAREQAAREEQQRQRQEAERQRQAELRLQELRERQERERAEEQARQAAELERIREQRAEAERQRVIEEERLKQLAARREQEAAAQRQAEEEAALQQALAAEQAQVRAGQLASLRDQYAAAIQAQVTNNWLRPPTARAGLDCSISIVQIPGGDVISAAIRGNCNGDEATRRSLIAAVERAGALPYRGFEDVFEREINFRFRYDGD